MQVTCVCVSVPMAASDWLASRPVLGAAAPVGDGHNYVGVNGRAPPCVRLGQCAGLPRESTRAILIFHTARRRNRSPAASSLRLELRMTDSTTQRVAQALPEQAISHEVLLEKYAKGDERSVDDVRARVARALASVEAPALRTQWEARFFDAQRSGFIPAGRIDSAAGTALGATLINCFVQPVGDSIAEPEDGHPGIYIALTEAAETMRRGGGVGYDFSRIRPKGAWVGSTQSHASGPVSYMRVFDRSCETVESAGSRRGAQMGVLRCDHPDVEEFIHAKDQGDLKNFNISVGVTDAFMDAVERDQEFELVHKAKPWPGGEGYARDDGMWVYRKVRARALWDQIMR